MCSSDLRECRRALALANKHTCYGPPPGLRQIAGFNDEARSGKWNGYRSSRRGLQYRVFYRTVPREQLFQVVAINAHDNRRP